MPEYPEVQALAERLENLYRGGQLEGIDPIQFSALKTVEPAPEDVLGRSLAGLDRRGKWLLLDLGGPRIAIHLSQGGRVTLEDPPKRTRPRGGIVRFRFVGRPGLMVREFGTERRAAWHLLAPGDEGPLAVLGPEAVSEEFLSWLQATDDSRRVHTILRDQRTVAGIGRGYADDILHRARLSPFASMSKLGLEERGRLASAIREVLEEALAEERKRSGGLPPKLGDHFAIHGRWGRPCPRCDENLRRISYESHEVTYCPRCQTGGKILADRRFSRLVR